MNNLEPSSDLRHRYTYTFLKQRKKTYENGNFGHADVSSFLFFFPGIFFIFAKLNYHLFRT